MDALEKLGLKRRILCEEIEGFGKVYLRDLTLDEWKGCIDGSENNDRKLLSLSLCDQEGKLHFPDADSVPYGTFPPQLIRGIIEKIAANSGLKADAAKN